MATLSRVGIHPDPKSDDGLLDLVSSRYQYSKNEYQSYHRKCVKWYEIYRMIYRGEFDKHRNFITIPLIFSTIQSDVARKHNTAFGTWPYIGMFGYGPEDTAIARKNELLISAQMKDCGTVLKGYDFLQQADLYGTAVMQHGWRYDEEMLASRQQFAAPVTGRLREVLRTEKVTTFDGPDWEVLDILDCFPQPRVHDVQDMSWFITREWVEMDEIRELVEAGIYDRSCLRKLELGRLFNESEGSFAERRMGVGTNASSPRLERYAQPVEVRHMWGSVPRDFIPDDKGTQRCVSIGNGNVIMRNRPIPFYHGRKPFLHYSPMRDPHNFFAPGKAEVSEKLQLSANKIACQKLDALDLFIDPMFVANRNAVDRRQLKTRPGGIILSDLPPQESIMALMPNMQGVQNAYQEVQDLWRWMQQATGIIEDVVMGLGNSSRTTAREFMGRQENVSVRLLMESRLAEEQWLEPMAQIFRAYNRQYLEVPKELKILGMNGQMDPVSGMPVPPEQALLTMDDLNMDYDVRAMGSTIAMGKSERQQRLATLFQMLSAFPQGAALINYTAYIREMFLANELYNTNELLYPPLGQMGAIGLMGQQGGAGAPGGAPGPPEQGTGGGGPPVSLAAGVAGLPPLPVGPGS